VTSSPSLPALETRDLAGAFAGEPRRRLELALAGFLQRQRWFGSKASAIAGVRVHDSGGLDAEGELAIAIVDVTFENHRTERYALPLSRLAGEDAGNCLQTRPHAVVGWLDAPNGPLLVDATTDDAACRKVGVLLAGPRERPLASGLLAVATDPGGETLAAVQAAPIVRTGAEQSNSSVIFSGAAILKIYRRLEAGPHPELEMGRYLRDRGFNDVPAVLASIEYVDRGDRYALAVAHELVADATDGWKHALASIRRYFERVNALPVPDTTALFAGGTAVAPGEPSSDAARLVGDYVDAARTLGSQTGRLHRILAEGTDDAFAPEPLSASDVARIVDSTRTRAARALSRLASSRASVPKAAAARVDRLLELQQSVFDRLDLHIDPGGAARTRCHQDYHLGQLLWTGERYALLDFEGEPARPLAERRAKRPPLTDVAGMLRSYSYAAWSGLFARARETDRDPMADRPWAAVWERAVAGVFMQRYIDATQDASFLPRDPHARAALLRVLMLDKALYELEYELNNRPDWILVPVEGLLDLL
jgi:trehalose synthase-fused probable maltokinase